MRYGISLVISSLLLIMIGLHARMTKQGYNDYQQRLSTLKAQIAQTDSELSVLYEKIAELRKQRSSFNEELKKLEDLLKRS
jgi:predicted  nucleic acid-binding Zn-ribbon protein